jgi:hypothetical protein
MPAIQSQQQRLQAGLQPIASPISLPAPTKGWNTRDEFDAMDSQDAVQLDNWFPDAGGVSVRKGSAVFASGLGSAPVSTLAEFVSASNNKLLAACSGKIWDISSGTGASLGTGFTSDRWQTVNFLKRLFFVNGQDAPQIYDGTTLSAASFTGTGLTLSTLWGVWQYQQRLFFWQQNSTGFWYALLNSMSGALAFFDLSAFCPRGGNLVAMTTSSYDGGNGVLDYAVFIMSSGDALLFSGNDPSLSSNWSLVGEYRIAPPVSPRAVTDYGGDSFLTTFDDHVTLQQMFTALRLGEMAPRSKVSKAVQLAVQANQSAFGWQALYYPRGRSLIFNVPNPDGTFNQHVCNTGLPDQPWCRYVGMNAYCWSLFNNLLYFGAATGAVYVADFGALDSLTPIEATAQQAWNKIGNAQRKRISAVRPVVQSIGTLAYTFSTGFDYAALNISVPGAAGAVGSPWDVSAWDVSPWSDEMTVGQAWRVGGGSGTSVSFGLVVSAVQPVTWFRTDIRMEGGNAL